jgi:hypothetical protein
MHDIRKFPPSYSTSTVLSHDARIALAFAEIDIENAPNYAHYARKYELVPSTLLQRSRGITTLRKEAIFEHY